MLVTAAAIAAPPPIPDLPAPQTLDEEMANQPWLPNPPSYADCEQVMAIQFKNIQERRMFYRCTTLLETHVQELVQSVRNGDIAAHYNPTVDNFMRHGLTSRKEAVAVFDFYIVAELRLLNRGDLARDWVANHDTSKLTDVLRTRR